VLRTRSRLVLADLRIPKRGIRNLAGSLTGQTAVEAQVPAGAPRVGADARASTVLAPDSLTTWDVPDCEGYTVAFA